MSVYSRYERSTGKTRFYLDFFPTGHKKDGRVRLKLPDQLKTKEEAIEEAERIGPQYRQLYVNRLEEGYNKVENLREMLDEAQVHFETYESNQIAKEVANLTVALIRFCRDHQIAENNILEPSPNFLEFYTRERAMTITKARVNRELYVFNLLHGFMASRRHCAPMTFDVHRLYLIDKNAPRTVTEKFYENLIRLFPEEFLEEKLTPTKKPEGFQTTFPDLLFLDANGEYVVVEIQKGDLDRKHAYKILEYRDKLEKCVPKHSIRMKVILIGGESPSDRREYLEKYRVEYTELPIRTVEAIVLKLLTRLKSFIVQ
jgi:hypothetical protein